MIDKIAPPFWVIWSVGIAIGFVTGDEIQWIVGGAVVGLIVGLLMAAKAKRDRERAFHPRGKTAAHPIMMPMEATPPPSEIDSAA